jgi:hypothetical protein
MSPVGTKPGLFISAHIAMQKITKPRRRISVVVRTDCARRGCCLIRARATDRAQSCAIALQASENCAASAWRTHQLKLLTMDEARRIAANKLPELLRNIPSSGKG